LHVFNSFSFNWFVTFDCFLCDIRSRGGGTRWAIWGGSTQKGCLFWARSILKCREICHFSIRKGHRIGYKVEEVVAKSEAYQRVSNFGRNANAKNMKACILWATEPEWLKAREKRADYRKCYCFGLSLRYKKWVQFCSRYMKGYHFGKN